MRPWLAAILAPFALATMMVPLVAAEPHAHADATSDGFYIDLLKGTDIYDRYGEQTLLREAYKVCDAIQRGTGEESATHMVESDLGLNNDRAFRVVSSVEVGMNCFSLKPYGMP